MSPFGLVFTCPGDRLYNRIVKPVSMHLVDCGLRLTHDTAKLHLDRAVARRIRSNVSELISAEVAGAHS